MGPFVSLWVCVVCMASCGCVCVCVCGCVCIASIMDKSQKTKVDPSKRKHAGNQYRDYSRASTARSGCLTGIIIIVIIITCLSSYCVISVSVLFNSVSSLGSGHRMLFGISVRLTRFNREYVNAR